MITNNRILWLPEEEFRSVAWDDTSPHSSRNPSGIRINSDTALQSTVVLACARLLAESIASLPLHIYEWLPNGGKAPARAHPLYRLLHMAPNSWQTSFEWREQQVLWLALWGNSYNLLIPGEAGFATELYPLHPSRMRCERIENGRLRYKYRTEQGGEEAYTQDQIMHIRWLSDDGINGMVPVELARDAIGLARACEIHGARYFGNGARPGFVLSTENDMKPETAASLRDNWEHMHRGPDRSNRTAVLFGGLKPLPLSGQSNQESQFLETRRFQIEEICRLYRCPPHLVGDLTRSSFSNIEQQSIDFTMHTLVPWLRRFENAFARDLIVEDEKFFAEFDIRGMLRGDAAARASYYSTLTNLGVVSINEIRSWENLNPVDGGDLRFVGLNMQSLEQANAAAAVQPPAAPGAEDTAKEEQPAPPTADVSGILAIVQQIGAGAVTPDAAAAIFASVFPQMPKSVADSIIAGAVVKKPAPPPGAPGAPGAPGSPPPAQQDSPTGAGSSPSAEGEAAVPAPQAARELYRDLVGVERRAATISIDFDRTFASDPELWGEFASEAAENGNKVVMISRREDTPDNEQEIFGTLGQYADRFSDVLLIGTDTLKDDAAKAAGIKVDIWVDDSPQTVRRRAFCPTGKDGGIDNSCSSKDGTGGGDDGKGDGGSKKTKCDPCYAPDVSEDKNNDGVTDAARVGVPALDVPPPPGLGQLPNLNEREREVEIEFMSRFNDDPDGVASTFRESVVNGKPPPTFGTDDAKALSPAWVDKDQETRAANRATLNTALHQTANAVAKRAFVQHLDTLKPGDEILVTVGGCGAGKGYAIKNNPEVLAMKDRAAAVWDSAGDQNATENPWILQEAEARGLRVNYVYVHADPRPTWADPNRGVVQRASNPEDGRMVDARVFADSYAIGSRNHHAFHQANLDNPNVSFRFIDNTGPKPAMIDGVPESARNIDRDELAGFAERTVREAQVPQRVKDGALVGGRIWGPIDGDGDGIVNEEEKNKQKRSKNPKDDFEPLPWGEDFDEWYREELDRVNAIGKYLIDNGYVAPDEGGKSQKKSEESRAFCPTGVGGGIDNSCSPKARGTSLTNADRSSGKVSEIKVGGVTAPDGTVKEPPRSIPLVTRDNITNVQYLDEVEADGADKGFAVELEQAAELQADDNGIDDEWAPYDLFTSNAWSYFTDTGAEGGSDGSIIDERAYDYGAISSDQMSEWVDERMTETWKELVGPVVNPGGTMEDEQALRNELGNDDYLSDFGLDPAQNTFRDLSQEQREEVFQAWKDDNESIYMDEFSSVQEDARTEAARVMRKELESSLAETELGCCIQLYRGLSLNQAQVDSIIRDGYIEHTATNSWTTGRSTARGFGAGQVLLVCRNPAVGYVRASDHASEQEITRPPSKMNIIAVVKTSSGTVLHVEEDRDYTVGGVRDTLVENDSDSDPAEITATAIAGARDGDGDGIVNEEEKNKNK